jgi:glycerol-3-phosphate acyltransferase PlsY
MSIYSFLAVPLGYILGSMPSTYIVGRLVGKVDMRGEGDGRISAAAIYRRLGRIQYALVLAMDIGKGALAIFIANLLTNSLALVLLAGFATMVGHCWSTFMKFKGGLGATVICGVLLATVFWQLVIGLAVGAIAMLITRKSGLSSAVAVIATSVVLLIQSLVQDQPLPGVLIIYPIILILLMALKRFQINRIAPEMPGSLDQSGKTKQRLD